MVLGNMIPFLLIILPTLFPLSIGRDTITPTQPLLGNETLISSNGSFALGFFTPPSSNNRYLGMWYNKITAPTIVWVANREKPITNSSTGTLSITTTGSLTITDDHNSTTIWSTTTAGLTNPVARLLDNGNFVVSANSENPSWQSFDHPTDTLLPGMKIGVNLSTGLDSILTAWKSESDPSSGEYGLAMDSGSGGDPQLYLVGSTNFVWRSGPWNGIGFSGLPNFIYQELFTFSVVNNGQQVTFSYQEAVPAQSRLVVNQSGAMQWSVWLEQSRRWSIYWTVPRDQCDIYNQCGPNGQCNINDSPICHCLQGFEPRNPVNWALRDGTDGCIRNRTLSCSDGTDGFVLVNNSKVPDTSEGAVHKNLSLSQCQALCLANCSCTAYASANISQSATRCILWVSNELNDIQVYTSVEEGQDLYLKIAGAGLGLATEANFNPALAIILSVAGLIFVFVISGLGLCLWRRRKKRRGGTSYFSDNNGQDGVLRENDLELAVFDFATIAAATNNFSIINKLGQGGFGPVFKGKLVQGQDIAVKRLSKASLQGIKEFKNEVVLIAKLQHTNLVRLLGCCIQGDERILIYEYMPNKSLNAFLFDKEKTALLDWQTRYRIILGIARGLMYLHQDSRLKIIHRDLKAHNVLLDEKMSPKISDFGMARILREDEAEVNTRRIVGTYGYMSPEYAMEGIYSVKSDVFSYGVLVLEIISGKRNRGTYGSSFDLNLVIHTWNLWNEGNCLDIVDKSMGNSFPVSEVLKCIRLGLLCVQEQPEYRPLMSEVILMLGNDSAALPQPREPGFIVRRGPSGSHSSSGKQDPGTLNDMSFTMLEAR